MIRFILIINFFIKLTFILYFSNSYTEIIQITLFLFLISNLISIMVWINKNKHIQFLEFQKYILDLQSDKKTLDQKDKHISLIDYMLSQLSPNKQKNYDEIKKYLIKFYINQIITLIVYGILSYLGLFQFLCYYLVAGIILSLLWHRALIQKQSKYRKEIDLFFKNIFTNEAI